VHVGAAAGDHVSPAAATVPTRAVSVCAAHTAFLLSEWAALLSTHCVGEAVCGQAVLRVHESLGVGS
jgi:hypothetical protein